MLESAYCSDPRLNSSLEHLWCINNPQRGTTLTPITSHLITDDTEAARIAEQAGYDAVTPITPVINNQAATEVEDTGFANLTAEVIDYLESGECADLLWIHSSGLSGNWDAPETLRDLYHDEEDPEIKIGITAPVSGVEDQIDEDYLAALQQAYAAQVTMIDSCLSVLIPLLEARVDRIIITSPRGYNLGHHGQIGINTGQLTEDVIHVPFILVDNTFRNNPVRNQWLFSTTQLGEWINSCGDNGNRDLNYGIFQSTDSVSPHIHDAPVMHQVIQLLSATERAIRTPAWHARYDLNTHEVIGIFAKPDDRWEANDISDRCGQAGELLADLATSSDDITELDNSLVLF